jgi:cell division protein FtsB
MDPIVTATLQTQLAKLTDDYNSLQVTIVDRQKELQQIDQRRSQLLDEITRNQGAVAYNRLLAERITKEMAQG